MHLLECAVAVSPGRFVQQSLSGESIYLERFMSAALGPAPSVTLELKATLAALSVDTAAIAVSAASFSGSASGDFDRSLVLRGLYRRADTNIAFCSAVNSSS